MKKLILGSALLALAGGAIPFTPAVEAAECLTLRTYGTPGAQLVALSDEAEATAAFCTERYAQYTSSAYYLTDGDDILLGTKNVTPEGSEVELGGFVAGDELVFYITVADTGHTYYTGPGQRNPDGLVHATVVDLGDGRIYVGFEDFFGSSIGYFHDVSLVLETSGVAVVDGDLDDDGFADEDDNCGALANPDQADLDGDGAGDLCDACIADADNDLDEDGFCGDVDNCPYDGNSNQSDLDSDGVGDTCDDEVDGDGVPNAGDNCVYDLNPTQSDLDGDGYGDACDADLDGDAVIDGADACVPTDPGDAVDVSGCSVDQLCPCEGMNGAPWKNHGGYVRCVSHTAEDFLDAGLVSEAEKDVLVSAAAHSSCGQ